ncbi:MAG: DsbA family oxidoreductase [Acidimicrobiales bacterium]
MRIDIWSDVICPWCYLGKRRLDLALGELDMADDVEIRWRAFQLDPTATSEPSDLRTSIDRKYGPGSFEGMTTRLGNLGAEVGIGYRFDIAKRVSTVDAHRLSAWALATEGVAAQGSLVERLFVAYFEEGANVADPSLLASMAAEVGLDHEAASEVVAGDAFADEVAADLHGAKERALTGVPAFVVEDRLLIPGAQDVETFVNLLGRARERFAS